MAKRPGGDLGAMAITKAKAAETVPFGATQAPVAPSSLEPKSLTVKLDGATYAELREFCHQREVRTGRRLTHQEVMVSALKAYLAGI
jgi:hypothetical protein